MELSAVGPGFPSLVEIMPGTRGWSEVSGMRGMGNLQRAVATEALAQSSASVYVPCERMRLLADEERCLWLRRLKAALALEQPALSEQEIDAAAVAELDQLQALICLRVQQREGELEWLTAERTARRWPGGDVLPGRVLG